MPSSEDCLANNRLYHSCIRFSINERPRSVRNSRHIRNPRVTFDNLTQPRHNCQLQVMQRHSKNCQQNDNDLSIGFFISLKLGTCGSQEDPFVIQAWTIQGTQRSEGATRCKIRCEEILEGLVIWLSTIVAEELWAENFLIGLRKCFITLFEARTLADRVVTSPVYENEMCGVNFRGRLE